MNNRHHTTTSKWLSILSPQRTGMRDGFVEAMAGIAPDYDKPRHHHKAIGYEWGRLVGAEYASKVGNATVHWPNAKIMCEEFAHAVNNKCGMPMI